MERFSPEPGTEELRPALEREAELVKSISHAAQWVRPEWKAWLVGSITDQPPLPSWSEAPGGNAEQQRVQAQSWRVPPDGILCSFLSLRTSR